MDNYEGKDVYRSRICLNTGPFSLKIANSLNLSGVLLVRDARLERLCYLFPFSAIHDITLPTEMGGGLFSRAFEIFVAFCPE